MSDDFGGKIAVITGAASGIGLATGKASMGAGATVVPVDHNETALFVLSRPRTVTIHDVVALPTDLDA